MVVLNWSWLRMVIITSSPSARVVRGVGNTVKRARPAGRGEPALADGVGQGEALVTADADVEVLEARDDGGDVVADAVVVAGQRGPVDGRCARPAPPGPGRRRWPPRCAAGATAGSSTPCDRCTRLIESSTVTNCSPAACRSRSLRPRQGRISACWPVTRCDRFSLVDTWAVRRQRVRAAAVRSVSGVAARKLPPRATNTLARPASMAPMAATVSRPGRRGRLEAEARLQSIQERAVDVLEDAHGAVALHVAVPAHRAGARPGAAEVAAQQQQVHHLLDAGDRVAVLGQAHGPAGDHPPAAGGDLRRLGHPLPVDAALLFQQRPGLGLQVRGQLGEALGVSLDEGAVDHRHRRWPPGLQLQHRLGDALQQGDVAADAHRQVQAGDGGAPAQHLQRVLGVAKPAERHLGQRVDADDAAAAPGGLLQGRQHARVVGARVLPEDEDGVGLVEVVQLDRALAHAQRLAQGHAAGLVAHVGAVGQVVGAELAHEQLVQERRLVAGAARGVEHRLVGIGQRPQLAGQQVERLVPVDRAVVAVARPPHQRLGQAALLAQPVIGLGGQLGDAVAGEEVGVRPARGGLPGDGLGAVLAELEVGSVLVGLGPGAARAVEAVVLVQGGQRPRAPQQGPVGVQVGGGGGQRRQAPGRAGAAPRW